MTDKRAHILVLGTADWQQTIATNQHYMTAELLEEFDVTFVNSIGLRRPELNRRDISRAWRRLTAGARSPESRRPVPKGLEVVSPTVVPIHRGLLSIANASLMAHAVRRWRSGSGAKILWTYSPVTYGIERFADAAVYHCVDLLAEFPGIDRRVISRSESTLAQQGFHSAGSSQVVVEHLRASGFAQPLYWPNVADTRTIAAALSDANGAHLVRRPAALFAGNLTTKKVDFELLRRLLDAGIELHLAGPIAEGGGNAGAEVDSLLARGAIYHGALDLKNLAALMASCTVGLIPYVSNAYTEGVSPLKTFEYLAAGMAVVSTALPGVDPIPRHVIACAGGDFVQNVQEAIPEVGDDVISDRTRIAEANSWVHRGRSGRELAHSLLDARVAR